jgi:hypothetical protein
MVFLLNEAGEPLHDSAGSKITKGSIVGQTIYMRWEKYGWQLGKIVEKITNRTPRLILKFNYRIIWSDGNKGPAKLGVDNYSHGADARYDSWVILNQKS